MNEYNNQNGFNPDGFTDSVSGVETITKKKHGKKIAIISGISVAALAGGGAIAYNVSPLVKNQVKLRTSSPKNYYAWVNEENAGDFAKSIADSYSELLDRYENGTTEKFVVEYEVSDGAKEAFLTEVLGSDYEDEVDEDTQQLLDIVNNIEQLKIGIDSSTKKNLMALNLYGELNGEELISLDFAGDFDQMALFARIPQLSEQYLGFSFGELLEENVDDETLIETITDVINDPASYLSPSELEKEINRYVKVWNKSVSKVKVEKKEEIGIGDIDVKYTVATVKIDEKTAEKIGENFKEALKNDEIIKEIIVEKLALMDEEEYEKSFEDDEEEDIDIDENEDFALDEEDEDDEDDKDEKEQIVSFSTYIDDKGVIRGFSFSDNSDEKNDIRFIIGKDGKDVRGEFVAITDGNEQFSAILTADESKGSYDGSIDITVHDYHYYFNDDDELVVSDDETTNISVEFEDFEIVDEEKCYVEGDITLVIPDTDPIELNLESDGKSQTINYNIVIDDTDFGTISLITSTEDGFEADIPSMDDAFEIDENFENDDIFSYVSEEELVDFVKELLKKIGFSDELAEEIITEM
ncbi:MAG: hypothetical protein PUB97_01285 [Ruminococcus sp.]|nr:hypothetical protein [Ruminococcus sp.]